MRAKVWDGSGWVDAVGNQEMPVLSSDGFLLASSQLPVVTATASATPHTAGAWQEVIASTSTDLSAVTIMNQTATAANGVNTSTLLDIGVGAAASESVVVSSIPVGYQDAFRARLDVPLPSIPAGSRIAVRIRSAVVSKTFAAFYTFGRVPNPPASVLTLGADTGASKGTSIAGAAVNTWSSWVELEDSTPSRISALFLGIQGDGDTALASASPVLVQVGVGPASSEVVLFTASWQSADGNESYQQRSPTTSACDIPAGSRLAVRWARSNTANSLDALLIAAA